LVCFPDTKFWHIAFRYCYHDHNADAISESFFLGPSGISEPLVNQYYYYGWHDSVCNPEYNGISKYNGKIIRAAHHHRSCFADLV
jgi:hypothetical protein